jgi:hypothetical protein
MTVRRKKTVVGWALITTSALMLAYAIPSFADFNDGEFSVKCRYVKTANDDAILYSTQSAGYSHQHEFFGNRSITGTTVPGTLQGNPTRCSIPEDSTAYWAPSIQVNGVYVQPDYVNAYYIAHNTNVTHVKYLKGQEMLGGGTFCATAGDTNCAYSAAAPPPTNKLAWFCGGGSVDSTPLSRHPYDCTPYITSGTAIDGVTAIVRFPSCHLAGGSNLPSSLVWSNATTGACPAGYEYLPETSIRVHYNIASPCKPGIPAAVDPQHPDAPSCAFDTPLSVYNSVTAPVNALTVATGHNCKDEPSGCPYLGYWTMHGDFMNGWQSGTSLTSINSLIEKCLNGHMICGPQP